MRTPAFIVAVLSLMAASAAAAAPRDGMTITHSERLERLSIRQLDSRARSSSASSAAVSMQFDAMGRRFDLGLEPNTALLSAEARAAIAERIPGRLSVLRGSIDGDARTWARIVLVDGKPNGMLFDGNELLAIETADGPDAEPVIFRLADMVIEPGTMSCGAGAAPLTGQQMVDSLVAEMTPRLGRAEGAVEEIEIGALGDADFSSGRSNPEQAILTRLNSVDGIYSSELGIQIRVPLVEIFDAASDPLTDTTDSEVLIDELAAYRQSSAGQNQLGLTHLFTGRTLDGSTVGIAYIGALCSTRFGVGLSEGNRGSTIDSLIAAHEIGHNFGADHDGDPDGSCPDAQGNLFIMATRVNGNPQFSDCSKSVMLAEAARAACVVPLPSSDVSISSVGQPESVLLGNAINLNFAIDNRGSLDAANVEVDISLPTNVTLIAASASQGSCTSGASSVSCSIGSVAGSSGESVTVTASADAVGQAAFDAAVSADADELTSNNADTHVVTIEPAVNLVVNAPVNANVILEQNGTATIIIDNTSSLEASGVTASIALDAGISANGASWTAGDCTVAAQQVDCTAATFAAMSSSTLSLDVRGVTTGSRNYTVTLASTETDSSPADNEASGTVTVSTASQNSNSGSSSGGGGSLGLLFLALLGVFGSRRHIRV